nr:hypothetical protein [uncultured Desulfobulbus sp.]
MPLENISSHLEKQPLSRFNRLPFQRILSTVTQNAPQFGVHGRYHICKEYDSPGKATEFAQRQAEDAQAILGEDMSLLKNEGTLGMRFLQRGTFNLD